MSKFKLYRKLQIKEAAKGPLYTRGLSRRSRDWEIDAAGRFPFRRSGGEFAAFHCTIPQPLRASSLYTFGALGELPLQCNSEIVCFSNLLI